MMQLKDFSKLDIAFFAADGSIFMKGLGGDDINFVFTVFYLSVINYTGDKNRNMKILKNMHKK